MPVALGIISLNLDGGMKLGLPCLFAGVLFKIHKDEFQFQSSMYSIAVRATPSATSAVHWWFHSEALAKFPLKLMNNLLE